MTSGFRPTSGSPISRALAPDAVASVAHGHYHHTVVQWTGNAGLAVGGWSTQIISAFFDEMDYMHCFIVGQMFAVGFTLEWIFRQTCTPRNYCAERRQRNVEN